MAMLLNQLLCASDHVGCHEYRYLGLLLTEHLDYDTMAMYAAKSASRALGFLIAKSKLLGTPRSQNFMTVWFGHYYVLWSWHLGL